MTAGEILERLREFDLMLASDARFPSVAGLVVGGELRGSWWALPQGKEVYRLAGALVEHPDVLTIKLVSGKVTFVHRPLWPAVVAVGSAREPWQMRGLSKDAAALLKTLDNTGTMPASGDAVRELERRLLIRSESVHTERGNHVKELEGWTSWVKSVRLGKVKMSPAEGRAQIEAVVARLNAQFRAHGTLPWQSRPRTSARKRKSMADVIR